MKILRRIFCRHQIDAKAYTGLYHDTKIGGYWIVCDRCGAAYHFFGLEQFEKYKNGGIPYKGFWNNRTTVTENENAK